MWWAFKGNAATKIRVSVEIGSTWDDDTCPNIDTRSWHLPPRGLKVAFQLDEFQRVPRVRSTGIVDWELL